jgi:hypothetical protein
MQVIAIKTVPVDLDSDLDKRIVINPLHVKRTEFDRNTV